MTKSDVELRPFTGAQLDVALVLRVLESQPAYALQSTGRPVEAADAVEFLFESPDGTADDDKLPFGVWRGDELVALLDVVRHWPRHGTLMIGLLLVDDRVQRTGVGSAAFSALLDLARTWPDVDRLRIGVLTTNTEAIPFWKSVGFVATGEIKPYNHGTFEAEVAIYEREL